MSEGVARAIVGDATRDALVRAARAILAADGPTALTVRRIATDAGMSTMNVYSRFGGKDGVLDELFIDGFTQLGTAMAQVPDTDDPAADLVACGLAYVEFAHTAAASYSLMFDRIVPDYNPSATARAVGRGVFDGLVERVQRALDAGSFAGGDATTIAGGLWAQVHGLASLGTILAADPEPFADLDWAAVMRVALAAQLRGLSAAPATGS
ncbi:MAG: TetR/AcrR family transcriptional regulator [Desertimonas sp.]